MALTGLLLLTSSTLNVSSRTRLTLLAAKKHLTGVLYVYPWNWCDLADTDGRIRNFGRLSSALYAQANTYCPHLDVRLLLRKPTSAVDRLDVVMLEAPLTRSAVDAFVTQYFPKRGDDDLRVEVLNESLDTEEVDTADDDASITTLGNQENVIENLAVNKTYNVLALGGTFDRMHNAHKILLSEAVLRCDNEIIVGVTDDEMVKSKLLFELIEPCERRLRRVQEFLNVVGPFLKHRIVPLHDPFGPTITDPTCEMIVVSSETVKSAYKINEIREGKSFKPLDIHSIKLFKDKLKQNQQEEDKISSSSQRIRILGQRLRQPNKIPSVPYIIGLTGGIASGKSTLCSYMNSNLGIPTINCDALGHEAYHAGTACFEKLVETFGESILTPSKEEINRRALGNKVFNDQVALKKLTDIVWPEIRKLVQAKIDEFVVQGHKCIVLDAAVLLEAGWDDFCHDVWVVIIPRQEAVRRVMERDNLSSEAAEARLNAQVSNFEKAARATFVFSSLWEVEFTRSQADRAWQQIKPVIDAL